MCVISIMQSTPSGPTPSPQQQFRGNRRGRHGGPNPPLSASSVSDRSSFSTTIWEQKLKNKNHKKLLLKQLNKELQDEVWKNLQKLRESLEEDKWLYEGGTPVEGIRF